MRDSSWQGGVTFGTSAAFRRHVGPLPSAQGGPTFFVHRERRSRMTNHNDKHGMTCGRRAAAHELFARKLVYRVIMPTFVLCILRGKSVEREPAGKTVADRRERVSPFLSSSVTLKSSFVPSLALISVKKNRAIVFQYQNVVSLIFRIISL